MARRPVSSAATPPHELSRDVYGFTVRPHHVKIYKQFAEIYKDEEAERSSRWEDFLIAYGNPPENAGGASGKQNVSNFGVSNSEDEEKKEKAARRKFRTWCDVRASLQPVEKAVQDRLKKNLMQHAVASSSHERITEPSSAIHTSRESEDDSDEEFFDAERVDTLQEVPHSFEVERGESGHDWEDSCQLEAELDALVRGGVPMALRGEVWQVFLGSSSRRVAGRYEALLTMPGDGELSGNSQRDFHEQTKAVEWTQSTGLNPAKWTKQIEKDIPRTFPGHPALDANGRNALRRLLLAYAAHNANVGYCQAMNFFAGLLLLMMPEENSFWTLTGILDDCFEGYYSEKMLEFQVDQMVLEELVRLHFPRLTMHLDALGLQMAWISGPWFLSIFVNVLPWESVLRVWDVLFYEGNRSMLFRTTLALLELHGSAVLTANDTGDALTMLQSLVSGTFDSSQLVLTACVGYQTVRESDLQHLRDKHRPAVQAMLSEQSMWRKPFGSISFSPNFMECGSAGNANIDSMSEGRLEQSLPIQHLAVHGNADCPLEGDRACSSDVAEAEIADKGAIFADLSRQVSYMKLELSGALEDRRLAVLRAEDLETAFMELVREDNRRLLSAKVETLEAEAAHLKQVLADKAEQDQAMIQVMVRMEHELKATNEARRLAEQDAKAQRNTLKALQVKYDSVMALFKELEDRAAKAEQSLDATSQCQALDNGVSSIKAHSITAAPGPSRWGWSWNTPKVSGIGMQNETIRTAIESEHDELPFSHNLLSRTFSFGWREKSKAAGVQDGSQTETMPSEETLLHSSSPQSNVKKPWTSW